MILKFNSGRGALLCEQCRVIVMEDLRDYEWSALRHLDEDGKTWFCKGCSPEDNIQKEQGFMFVNKVNEISGDFQKQHQEYIQSRIRN